jgi:phosphoribosylpyrophosphate synthetase
MRLSRDPFLAETSRSRAVFGSDWPQYNQPDRIVTLGHYYPRSLVETAQELVREPGAAYPIGTDARAIRQNLGWTRLINALNDERKWPLKRLFALLDPMLEKEIALAVVPTHIAYKAFWPMRALAQQLAANGRVDATGCLLRHTTVRRITYGGPSTRELHRRTIRVENLAAVQGRRVLLLDDIAKSGASLLACRELLYEAGAERVQAMALGQVMARGRETSGR